MQVAPSRPRPSKSADLVINEIINRLEVAAEVVPFSCEQWATIAAILFPEQFRSPSDDPLPTPHQPGTRAKVEEMARRESEGRRIWSPRDAQRK